MPLRPLPSLVPSHERYSVSTATIFLCYLLWFLSARFFFFSFSSISLLLSHIVLLFLVFLHLLPFSFCFFFSWPSPFSCSITICIQRPWHACCFCYPFLSPPSATPTSIISSPSVRSVFFSSLSMLV